MGGTGDTGDILEAGEEEGDVGGGDARPDRGHRGLGVARLSAAAPGTERRFLSRVFVLRLRLDCVLRRLALTVQRLQVSQGVKFKAFLGRKAHGGQGGSLGGRAGGLRGLGGRGTGAGAPGLRVVALCWRPVLAARAVQPHPLAVSLRDPGHWARAQLAGGGGQALGLQGLPLVFLGARWRGGRHGGECLLDRLHTNLKTVFAVSVSGGLLVNITIKPEIEDKSVREK